MTLNFPTCFILWLIRYKEKIIGTNFIDGYYNLRIILKQEKKEYNVEIPYPNEPAHSSSNDGWSDFVTL